LVADALTRSFEGYVGPVDVSAWGYEQRFRPENVDPFSSYVYFRKNRPVAIILIARRGWTSRVAAMAAVPEERGRGFGKRRRRRKGWATRLMRALYAQYPDKAWSIPQLVPEGLAPAYFAWSGWTLQDTNQLEMVLDLSHKP
jgi:GNAT superfamily N-acetyltransferase